MSRSIKLAILILSLGAAAAQASPWGDWQAVPIVTDTPIGTMTKEMFTPFGNATSGGVLHAASYSAGAMGGRIFYQITNNTGSSNMISGILDSAEDLPMSGFTKNIWTSQIKGAFGSFVEGITAAGGVSSLTSGGDYNDGTGIHLFTQTSVYFNEYSFGHLHVGIPDEPVLGIAPSDSSYIGVVEANDGRFGGSVNYGTINIDGWQVASIVSTVPEPETYALMLAGLGLVGAVVRRRKVNQDTPAKPKQA